MDTNELSVLVATVSSGSISAAARRLGISPVIASRRLAGLERELGVRLLHRTTRSIALTPEGEDFLLHAQAILESEAAAVSALNPGQTGAVGLLRATAPAALGREVIVPMLPGLLERNPQLKLELHLTERIVDVVGEGFDVAVRIADLRESNLVARRLGSVRRVLCASPDYIARRGQPSTIDELREHDCLVLVGVTHWGFVSGESVQRVRVAGPLSCSTIDGLQAACLQGLGISMHASWSVRDDLQTGRLVELTLDKPPYAPAVSAVYPSARMVTPKVRLFLGALSTALADETTA